MAGTGDAISLLACARTVIEAPAATFAVLERLWAYRAAISGSDGGVFAFHAPFYGSMGGKALNEPIVGIAADPLTGGYWEVAADGGIFAFNAPFYGSMSGKALNEPIVGIAATT